MKYAKAVMAVLGAVLTAVSQVGGGANRDQIIGVIITTAVTAWGVYRVPNATRGPLQRRQAPASVTLYPEPDPEPDGPYKPMTADGRFPTFPSMGKIPHSPAQCDRNGHPHPGPCIAPPSDAA